MHAALTDPAQTELVAVTIAEAMGKLEMQRMIENLLELARADAGQLEVASEAVDLVALLKDCWTQFA